MMMVASFVCVFEKCTKGSCHTVSTLTHKGSDELPLAHLSCHRTIPALLAAKLVSESKRSTKQEAEQAGADQPATKPADKAPVKDQPSTPTSKDGPR